MAELRREVLELRRQARYYRRMHGKAVEREKRLKTQLQAARAKLKELRQRLRERWARRSGSEKRTRSAGGTEAAAAAPRRRCPDEQGPTAADGEHTRSPPPSRCGDLRRAPSLAAVHAGLIFLLEGTLRIGCHFR